MGYLTWAVIIVLILIIIGYAAIKYLLNYLADKGKIQLTSSPFMGICPSRWTKQSFANKTVCQEPGTVSYVDRCLNSDSSSRGSCPDENIRTVDGREYCLSHDITRGWNQQMYNGWGCLKSADTTQADVKIPK